MNPTARAHDLVSVAQSMIEVMSNEIDTLKRHDIAAIEPLQERKSALANLYQAHVREIAADPGMFKSIDPHLRDELAETVIRFETVAKANEIAVRAAMEMNSRLVQTIVAAARERLPQANGYTASGAAPGGYRRSGVPATPLTLNGQF